MKLRITLTLIIFFFFFQNSWSQEDFSFTIIVQDKITKRPIQGAKVYIEEARRAAIETDSNGVVEFPKIFKSEEQIDIQVIGGNNYLPFKEQAVVSSNLKLNSKTCELETNNNFLVVYGAVTDSKGNDLIKVPVQLKVDTITYEYKTNNYGDYQFSFPSNLQIRGNTFSLEISSYLNYKDFRIDASIPRNQQLLEYNIGLRKKFNWCAIGLPLSGVMGISLVTWGITEFSYAQNLYDDYKVYSIESDFLAKYPRFDSRSAAYEKIESKRKNSATLIYTGGSVLLLTGYGLYRCIRNTSDNRIDDNSVNLTPFFVNGYTGVTFKYKFQ